MKFSNANIEGFFSTNLNLYMVVDVIIKIITLHIEILTTIIAICLYIQVVVDCLSDL